MWIQQTSAKCGLSKTSAKFEQNISKISANILTHINNQFDLDKLYAKKTFSKTSAIHNSAKHQQTIRKLSAYYQQTSANINKHQQMCMHCA